jgi:hypothetical protein
MRMPTTLVVVIPVVVIPVVVIPVVVIPVVTVLRDGSEAAQAESEMAVPTGVRVAVHLRAMPM